MTIFLVCVYMTNKKNFGNNFSYIEILYMKLDGKKERTYDTYRDLFDEVKKSNQLKFYSYSYVLLYSFFEDRLKRLFETQCQVKNYKKKWKIQSFTF